MAEYIDNTEEQESLIDSIYRKYVRAISRAIGSTEFYEYFMGAISTAQNEIQFSNRRVVKSIDMSWVEAMEEAMDAMQTIIATPRNVIKEEELVVNVANAKKAGAETVRHLAGHTSLVEDFNYDTGDVRPSKLMQRYREDSITLYENRLVYTTMEYARHFVQIRHDALLEAMSDEFGAKLRLESDMVSATEQIHMDMFMHIKQIDSVLETDKKHGDVLARISRVLRLLNTYMLSDFAQQMAKQPRVSGSINKTNVLKKNPNYKAVLKLWEFMKDYKEVGYTIKIVEQSPEITERFEENIYRNILFNYLVLKGHLEDERSRRLPVPVKEKKEELKPKIIHEIIEELTDDYSLTDTEVRKILIEELTREQLMQEEAELRLRLVEEQEAKRKEALKQERAEKRVSEEQRRQQRAEEVKREQERLKKRSALDQKCKEILREEIDYFKINLAEQVEIRRKNEALWYQAKDDFIDLAAQMLEEELRRKAEEILKGYAIELKYFTENLPKRITLREQEQEKYLNALEEREKARKEKIAKRTMNKEKSSDKEKNSKKE